MHIFSSPFKANGKIRRVMSLFLTICISLTSLSVSSVSAYYTAGASGRSLESIPGLSVNTSCMAVLGTPCRSGQLLTAFAGVTIHETSNWAWGASARMHAMYLLGGGQNSEVSWHYSVDSAGAYQSIPENEKAWHAGDTELGVGNSSTIAIEICDNAEGSFDQAMANAEWLAADILFRHNVHLVSGALFQHHDFSPFGKNCPITIRDKGLWPEFCAKTQKYLDQMVSASKSVSAPGISYESYVQNIGWQGKVDNGTVSGTAGQSLRLEALSMHLENVDGSVEYRTYQQDAGWGDWVSDGGISGFAGQGRRTEAIQIRLTGTAANQYDISYCVNAQTYGWMGWAQNGESAGTTGYAYRIEAVRVLLTPKGSSIPGDTTRHFISTADSGVCYESSVQRIGWMGIVRDGATCGTSGQFKRLEAMKINLSNIDGGITYRTHVQDIGWMGWVSNGEVGGTTGQSKRMEAIEIMLTGAAAEQYDIYYRVHVENYGWMGWMVNGGTAGTQGQSLRIEAIQLVLVPKGGAAPVTAA